MNQKKKRKKKEDEGVVEYLIREVGEGVLSEF